MPEERLRHVLGRRGSHHHRADRQTENGQLDKAQICSVDESRYNINQPSCCLEQPCSAAASTSTSNVAAAVTPTTPGLQLDADADADDASAYGAATDADTNADAASGAELPPVDAAAAAADAADAGTASRLHPPAAQGDYSSTGCQVGGSCC